MSFLQNAKIRTKVLSIIIPICLIGMAGVAVVSSQFSSTVATYSHFIKNDEAAAVEMARANQGIAALSYSAYQILVYSSKDPEMVKFQSDYAESKKALLDRFVTVKQLIPVEAVVIDKLAAQANDIIALTDQAVKAGAADDNDTATRVLKQADPLIGAETGEGSGRWPQFVRTGSDCT